MVHCTIVAWNHNRVTASAMIPVQSVADLVYERFQAGYTNAVVTYHDIDKGTRFERHYNTYPLNNGGFGVVAGSTDKEAQTMAREMSAEEAADKVTSY